MDHMIGGRHACTEKQTVQPVPSNCLSKKNTQITKHANQCLMANEHRQVAHVDERESLFGVVRWHHLWHALSCRSDPALPLLTTKDLKAVEQLPRVQAQDCADENCGVCLIEFGELEVSEWGGAQMSSDWFTKRHSASPLWISVAKVLGALSALYCSPPFR